MKYAFIHQHRFQYGVTALCNRLNVSPSGYRYWKQQPVSIRQQKEQAIVIHLNQIHRECKSTYGYRRMVHAVRLQGINIGRNAVQRLMRKYGIMARYTTRDEARLSIFEYIEVFYNQLRLHSSLGYMSPNQFERVA